MFDGKMFGESIVDMVKAYVTRVTSPLEVRLAVLEARTVEAGQPGDKGDPGAPGLDGLGFDDMSEELADDGRTIIRRYSRGDQVKEFRHTFAVVLDRGVWRDGSYQRGDGVTWAGSFWIAQEDTSAKPDSGAGWRLAVKRGRDGRNKEASA